jgi:hypothetical protein|uniref:Uncharacterized protein n=1 Tax=viral metagenome TaxID=1070528 RepID=A0A6C0FDB7_9ZZZZ|tara:strand:+ start:7372 stop:7590 length:219 start_codon:yes stop_codon:yes gene_type:complete
MDKSTETSEPSQDKKLNLDDLKVENQEMALNLMGQFLELAQKRGAFNFQESAKIYECIKFFVPVPPTSDKND